MNKTFYTIIACLACILYYTFVHEGEQQEEIGSPVAEFPELLPEPPHEHEYVYTESGEVITKNKALAKTLYYYTLPVLTGVVLCKAL